MAKAKKTDYDHCVGALPYIRGPRGIKIVVVTNRSGGKWIVPKGQPEDGMSRREVAEMEAVEEAGAMGKLTRGLRAQCILRDGKKLYLYPLQVSDLLDEWPESSFRERKVLAADKAIDLISDKGLRRCVQRLVKRLD